MYFPFLRGRQYELLALRELVEHNRISNKILPIIEPIKFSSTFLNVISSFIEKKMKIAIVMNPSIGDFEKEISSNDKNVVHLDEYNEILNSEYIYKAYWMKEIDSSIINPLDNNIYLCKNHDDIVNYEMCCGISNPIYSLIPDDRTFRRKVLSNKVIFEDCFERKERNADYSLEPDSYFTENHLFFKDDGYVGFSDFSIIGDEYKETGFAPMAIAIHVVYFDKVKALRVHHFVSNSNYDINDPAGKYKEALEKLIEFESKMASINELNYRTSGLDFFINTFEKGSYPGLGTVKKYSIMHHLELISRFLGV